MSTKTTAPETRADRLRRQADTAIALSVEEGRVEKVYVNTTCRYEALCEVLSSLSDGHHERRPDIDTRITEFYGDDCSWTVRVVYAA